MASVDTYTKTGTKATKGAKLDAVIFGQKVDDFQVIKQAYLAYLSNRRQNYASTLKRGEVRGGGKKPWRQKGTGRARFGSSRNPIWRGGGVAFGPTGNENYTKKLSSKTKSLATRQALSLAVSSNKLVIIENFEVKSGKTKDAKNLLDKLNIAERTVICVDTKQPETTRAVKNLQNVHYTKADYLNVFDILNCDLLIVTEPALEVLNSRLKGGK